MMEVREIGSLERDDEGVNEEQFEPLETEETEDDSDDDGQTDG